MSGPLAHLEPLERALAARGFPAMSPWWRHTLESFYQSDRRQLVLRVGRRGGKSSTLARVAVLEALYGEHVVPPGDLGVMAIVSVSRDEASQRLRTVRAILDALRVKYRPIEGGVELEHKPVAFKVYAASIAGVSGFTAIGVIADEVSKWRDSETGANPATEVLAALRPTMATQKHARLFLSSSPVGSQDAHAVAFDIGDTAFQQTAHAPTWEANPTISEEHTHGLEPDPRIWSREYAAEPQAGALGAFDADQVDRALALRVPPAYTRSSRVVLVDPSGGGADSYTYCAVGWRHPPEGCRGTPILELDEVGGIADAAARGFTSDTIVSGIVGLARRTRATSIHSDQFERYALQSAVNRFGYNFHSHAWTAPKKERAVERVRGWLRDGQVSIPAGCKTMRDELLSFEERISPSGALTFAGKRGKHDDQAMLLILAGLVDIEGGLADSPLFEAQRLAAERWERDTHRLMTRLGYGHAEPGDEEREAHQARLLVFAKDLETRGRSD